MLKHGSLFSGIGGFELGAELAGIPTVWSCEIEKFQRQILKKHFPNTKQYADITHLRHPEAVDIVSGGFPCQDVSIAGKGKGITGANSGLWVEMYRIVDEVRPPYIIIENSPELLKRGFERVLFPLSEIGYNVEWQCLSGTTFGIQQRRERVYCIAYSNKVRLQRGIEKKVFSESILQRESTRISPGWRTRRDIPEPRNFRSVNDLPDLVDRVGSIGNAVIPAIAKYLFECIKDHYNSFNHAR